MVAANAPRLSEVVASVPAVGKVSVVAPVVVNVVENAPAVARVLPSARDKVAVVPGSVIVRSLMLVAAAAPSTGVTRVGEVPNTARPDPVSSESAPARPAEFVKVFCLPAAEVVTAASAYAVVATWVLLLPAAAVGATGIPVRLAAEIVGAVPKTASPVPVSSVIFPRSCAEVVAAKAPKLLVVVANVPVVGKVSVVAPVVVNVVENAPAVARVLPSARDNVAVVPGSVIVRSLMLVAAAAPSTGVTRVGEVPNTARPDPVSSESAPARPAEFVKVFCLPAAEVVTAASAYAVVATWVLLLPAAAVGATGIPVRLAADIVGAVPNTTRPVPVSLVILPASCADVVAANAPRLSEVVASVPAVGKVSVVAPVVVNVVENAPAVARVLPSARDKVAVVPGSVIVRSLMLVAAAAPSTGVTRVGEVPNTARPDPVSSESAPARPAELVNVFCLPAAEVVTALSAYAVVAT